MVNQSTLPTDTRDDQDSHHNPAQADADRTFNRPINDLSGAEQRAASQTADPDSSSNIDAKEQAAGGDGSGPNSSNGYYQKSENPKGKDSSFLSKLKQNTRLRIATGIVAVITGGGAIFGFGALPGLTLINAKEVFSLAAGAKLETVLNMRQNQIWMKKINASSNTPTLKGFCANKIQVACRYQGMSDRAINKLTTRAEKSGVKISVESSENKVLGKRTIKSITVDGKKMTPPQFAEALRTGDTKVRAAMQAVMKPRYVAWTGAKIQRLFIKLGISKSMSVVGEADKEKAKQKIRANQAGVSDLDGMARETINPDDTDEEKKRKETTNTLIDKFKDLRSAELGARLRTSVLSNLTENTAKAAQDAAAVLGKSVSITGTIDSACTILNLISATGYMAKYLGSVQLTRFAMTYASSADAIKLGGKDVTPEGIQAMGELLTTTVAGDKRTAFDSYGYQYSAYGRYGDSVDTAEFRLGAGIPEGLLGFVSAVRGATNSGAACKIIQHPGVRIGSFVVGIFAAIFSGGSIPMIQIGLQSALGVGLSIIQAFSLPLIADMVSGDFVNDTTVGNSAGNALTAGFEELFAQNSNAVGLYPLSVDEAVEFDEKEQASYLVNRDSESVQETGQFDATNPSSFLGSILMRSASIIHSPSLADASGKMLSFITLPFSSTTYAASSPRDKYTGCPDDEYANELMIATTHMCVPVLAQTGQDMRRDPEETLLFMYEKGYIDNTGNPLIDYQKFITECSENTNPFGRESDDTPIDTIKPERCIPSKSNYPRQFWSFTTDDALHEKEQCLVEEETASCGATLGTLAPGGSGICPASPLIDDYGQQDGYDDGKQVKINTCGIKDWPSNFPNSNGDKIVEVNAEIAEQTAQMAAALKADAAANSYSFTASLGFRTYEQQKCIYDYFRTGTRGCSDYATKPNDAASPGFSNHQMGYSIDLESGYRCSNRTYAENAKANAWLDNNMKTYGFSRDVGCGDWGHFTNKGSSGPI